MTLMPRTGCNSLLKMKNTSREWMMRKMRNRV